MAPRPHPVILVLGMHRSGTSAMTRMLNLLGADIGPDPETEVWEQPGLMDIHERALAAVGLEAWDDASPLPADAWASDRLDRFQDELIAWASEHYAADRPWVVKDPRMCRLAPLWWPVLQRLGRPPVCVLLARHPTEVAASLERRDALAAGHAHALWLRHMLEADAATRDRPRVVVAYTDLLANWRAVARRLRKELGLAWPRPLKDASGEIDRFLSPDQRHHHFGVELDWPAEARAVRWLSAAWDGLMQLTAGEESRGRRRLTTVRKEFDAASWLWTRTDRANASAATTSLYATAERWDHGQPDRTGVLDELLADRPVNFELVPHHGNFSGFDLLLGTYARRNTCSLVVTVTGSDGEPVITRSLAGSGVADNAWHPVRFPPQSDSGGRPYRVEIASPDASEGNALTLYCDGDGRPTYRAYYATLVDAAVPDAGESAGTGSPGPSVDTVARLVDDVATLRRCLEQVEASRAADDERGLRHQDRVEALARSVEGLHADVTGLAPLEGRTARLEVGAADAAPRLLALETGVATREHVDELGRRLQSYEQRAAEAAERVAELQRRADGADETAGQLDERLTRIDERVAQITGRHGDKLTQIDEQVDALASRVDSQLDELAERTDAVQDDAREQLGRLHEHLTDSAARLGTLENEVRAQQQRTDAALVQAQDATRELAAQLPAALGELETLCDGLGRRLKDLDGRQRTAVAAWRAELARLDARRREDQAELQHESLRLREDHVALREEITRARSALGDEQTQTSAALQVLERNLRDAEGRLGEAARRVETLHRNLAVVDARVDAGFDVIREALEGESVS